MIISCIPEQTKMDLLMGVHQAGDTYRLALCPTNAEIGPSSVFYGEGMEIPRRGGYRSVDLSGYEVRPGASLHFKDVRWEDATITARGAVIYNASKENRLLVVMDFGETVTSTNGTFSVLMPDSGVVQYANA